MSDYEAQGYSGGTHYMTVTPSVAAFMAWQRFGLITSFLPWIPPVVVYTPPVPESSANDEEEPVPVTPEEESKPDPIPVVNTPDPLPMPEETTDDDSQLGAVPVPVVPPPNPPLVDQPRPGTKPPSNVPKAPAIIRVTGSRAARVAVSTIVKPLLGPVGWGLVVYDTALLASYLYDQYKKDPAIVREIREIPEVKELESSTWVVPDEILDIAVTTIETPSHRKVSKPVPVPVKTPIPEIIVRPRYRPNRHRDVVEFDFNLPLDIPVPGRIIVPRVGVGHSTPLPQRHPLPNISPKEIPDVVFPGPTPPLRLPRPSQETWRDLPSSAPDTAIQLETDAPGLLRLRVRTDDLPDPAARAKRENRPRHDRKTSGVYSYIGLLKIANMTWGTVSEILDLQRILMQNIYISTDNDDEYYVVSPQSIRDPGSRYEFRIFNNQSLASMPVQAQKEVLLGIASGRVRPEHWYFDVDGFLLDFGRMHVLDTAVGMSSHLQRHAINKHGLGDFMPALDITNMTTWFKNINQSLEWDKE